MTQSDFIQTQIEHLKFQNMDLSCHFWMRSMQLDEIALELRYIKIKTAKNNKRIKRLEKKERRLQRANRLSIIGIIRRPVPQNFRQDRQVVGD